MSQQPLDHRRAKGLIFMTIFIDLLGFGMIIPILPMIASELVADTERHGMASAALMVAFSLLQMIFSPFWGRLSDRFGRRPVLLASLVGSSISYLLFAFSMNYQWLLISRVFAGIFGGNITAAQAYIADITPDEKRTLGMRLVGMAFGLGFAFGPVLGGGAVRVAEWLDLGWVAWRGPGLLAAGICGLNLLGAIWYLPESRKPGKSASHEDKPSLKRVTVVMTRYRDLGGLIYFYFVTTFCFAALEISFPLIAERRLGLGVEGLYGLLVFFGLFMAFVQGYLVRRLMKKFAEAWIIRLGVIPFTIGLVLFPASQSWGGMLFFVSLLALGLGMIQPCLLGLLSRKTDSGIQGEVFGTNQRFSALARILGPLCAGILFDQVSEMAPYWFSAVLLVVSWVMIRKALSLPDIAPEEGTS